MILLNFNTYRIEIVSFSFQTFMNKQQNRPSLQILVSFLTIEANSIFYSELLKFP